MYADGFDWKTYERLYYRERNDIPPGEREDENQPAGSHQDEQPQEEDQEYLGEGIA